MWCVSEWAMYWQCILKWFWGVSKTREQLYEGSPCRNWKQRNTSPSPSCILSPVPLSALFHIPSHRFHFLCTIVAHNSDGRFCVGHLPMHWIGFPRGSVSKRHLNVKKSVWWVTLFDSAAYGAEWVLISALRVKAATKCHTCHVSCSGVWCCAGWKH